MPSTRYSKTVSICVYTLFFHTSVPNNPATVKILIWANCASVTSILAREGGNNDLCEWRVVKCMGDFEFTFFNQEAWRDLKLTIFHKNL